MEAKKNSTNSINKLVDYCRLKKIIITDRKDFLIGLDNYLDSNLIKTWEDVLFLYSSSINIPKDTNDYGRFLSLAGKLSQGWVGYLTDTDLFDRNIIREIVKDLFNLDIEQFRYFDWCLELSCGKYEITLQEYWNRLDICDREKFLKTYIDKLIRSIIDVFCISLNRNDFNRIFQNLDLDIQTDLIKFDLI